MQCSLAGRRFPRSSIESGTPAGCNVYRDAGDTMAAPRRICNVPNQSSYDERRYDIAPRRSARWSDLTSMTFTPTGVVGRLCKAVPLIVCRGLESRVVDRDVVFDLCESGYYLYWPFGAQDKRQLDSVNVPIVFVIVLHRCRAINHIPAR